MAGNPFVKGDKVWLHNAAVPRGHSKKLHRFWKGPYTVVDVLNNNVKPVLPSRVMCQRMCHKRQILHGEKMEVEAESEDENYGMLVVRNRTAQLAPADTEMLSAFGRFNQWGVRFRP